MGAVAGAVAARPPLARAWALPADDVLAALGATEAGLTGDEAAARLAAYGANRLRSVRRSGVLHELRRQFTEPIVLILIGASVLSLLLGDTLDASIILVIILLSGLLGFWQEHGAEVIVSRLLAQVQVHVEVRRDGRVLSVVPDDVVPGDVVVLRAGDLVPCDCRLLTAESLQVDEAALTGETYPRHKHVEPAAAEAELAERHSSLFQGSHVVSGQGTAVAVTTGEHTELGTMSRSLTSAAPRTSFEQGITRFGVMLARVTAILTAAILVVNLVLGRPLIDAVLFSLALAIGVTPQMLPAIVAVSLATGARRMARARVIVRRLDAIEDLGAMDVLCTDKTGTLTRGSLTLDLALDPEGRPSDGVAALAAVNAGLQTGFGNPLDDAILAAHRPDPAWRAVGELPFDFERKRLSVLAANRAGERVLVTKGAYDRVLDACVTVAADGGSRPVSSVRDALDATFADLSRQGYRVLALARRALPGATAPTLEDEAGLELVGFLAFLDPPKPGVEQALADLARSGVRLCMLTGDNRLVARHVAEAVGMREPRVVTGAEVDGMDDAALVQAAASTQAFAELSPVHKERIVEAARAGGAVVGYLGDGINDAGSLHLADVGISVDTAVDVAKSAAALVLLDKDLGAVVEGVRLGRRTFANTLKYVYTTISSMFGNTASMAAASAFLPFLPLLPRQILLLNFLGDLPSLTIAADHVDRELVARPRRWDVGQVAQFMVVFGLLSSAFDLLTFALLLHVFHAGATLFRSGWFVGSTLTEIAVLLVLRTRRLAFRSTPARALVLATTAVGMIAVALPYTGPLADSLGLRALSWRLLLMLVGVTAVYIGSAELTKRWFYRVTSTGPAYRASTGAQGPARRQHRSMRHMAHAHGRR